MSLKDTVIALTKRVEILKAPLLKAEEILLNGDTDSYFDKDSRILFKGLVQAHENIFEEMIAALSIVGDDEYSAAQDEIARLKLELEDTAKRLASFYIIDFSMDEILFYVAKAVVAEPDTDYVFLLKALLDMQGLRKYVTLFKNTLIDDYGDRSKIMVDGNPKLTIPVCDACRMKHGIFSVKNTTAGEAKDAEKEAEAAALKESAGIDGMKKII